MVGDWSTWHGAAAFIHLSEADWVEGWPSTTTLLEVCGEERGRQTRRGAWQ